MLRKEEARNRRSQARTGALSPQRVPMTRGALLRSRVKGNCAPCHARSELPPEEAGGQSR
jgi:hypothetical protein